MRNRFDAQLLQLNRMLIHMGDLCGIAIENATKALQDGNIQMAYDVMTADAEIDQAERDIERLCLTLLLQQQPVARDLRQISSALKMITDMERIGDQASDIAEIVVSAQLSEATDFPKIVEMSVEVTHMVEDSIKAFVDKNLELAGCYYQEPMSYPALLSWCEAQAAELWPYIVDTGAYLEEALKEGKRVVLEAQLGAMRDIDYGIFPYTSSSSTISPYGPIMAGIPRKQLDHVVGVLKAYSTCVGAGPFTAEKAMPESWMELLRKFGGEYGAATGRPRRVGPFDAVASRYGLKCQNADKIALTKLDVLSMMKEIPVIKKKKKGNQEVTDFDPIEDLEEYVPIVRMLPGWQTDISGCVTYDELPDAAKTYVETLEDLLQHEIQFISVGAERSQYLTKGEWL